MGSSLRETLNLWTGAGCSTDTHTKLGGREEGKKTGQRKMTLENCISRGQHTYTRYIQHTTNGCRQNPAYVLYSTFWGVQIIKLSTVIFIVAIIVVMIIIFLIITIRPKFSTVHSLGDIMTSGDGMNLGRWHKTKNQTFQFIESTGQKTGWVKTMINTNHNWFYRVWFRWYRLYNTVKS